jgi:uncharacterized repeat protein (TIGR01451 family)
MKKQHISKKEKEHLFTTPSVSLITWILIGACLIPLASSCIPTPAIEVIKTGPAFAYAGETITYTYYVSNPNHQPLSSVSVIDDVCGAATYVSGEKNHNGKLDHKETWVFTCTSTPDFEAIFPDPLTNTVTAQGTWVDAPASVAHQIAEDTDSFTLYPFILRKDVIREHGGTTIDHDDPETLFTIQMSKDGEILDIFSISESAPKRIWLSPGTYEFTEITIPEGYVPDDDSITITTGVSSSFTFINVIPDNGDGDNGDGDNGDNGEGDNGDNGDNDEGDNGDGDNGDGDNGDNGEGDNGDGDNGDGDNGDNGEGDNGDGDNGDGDNGDGDNGDNGESDNGDGDNGDNGDNGDGENGDDDNGEQGEEPIQTTRKSHGFGYGNIPPIANAQGPYNALCNEEILFNASASYDPDGFIILYRWSFGDGSIREGATVTYSYSNPGTYPVTLTVIDNFGSSDINETYASIAMPNSPPTDPLIAGLHNGFTNTYYSYVIGSFDDDSDELSYLIDWGDDTTHQTTMLPSGQHFVLQHRWSKPGTYTITVTASDGSLAATSEKDVKIQEMLVVDNIWIIVLALLALIALLAILLHSRKKKKSE